MSQSMFAAFADRLAVANPRRLNLSTFTPAVLKTETLSGLTVALALVPEAVAFAFVAGVHPLVGLYAAFLVGLITAVLGGRPGMISGATGALAVVMVALVADHGVEYLFATVVLMGILQILAGIFRLGKFIRLVPHPVMLGFVNGLAIVIGLAQLTQFKVPGWGGGGGGGGGRGHGPWHRRRRVDERHAAFPDAGPHRPHHADHLGDAQADQSRARALSRDCHHCRDCHCLWH